MSDMLERMAKVLERRQKRTDDLEDAPSELVELIAAAMVEHGPDGHSDGAEIIAAIVWDWVTERVID